MVFPKTRHDIKLGIFEHGKWPRNGSIQFAQPSYPQLKHAGALEYFHKSNTPQLSLFYSNFAVWNCVGPSDSCWPYKASSAQKIPYFKKAINIVNLYSNISIN